jgi:hypothetical protein
LRRFGLKADRGRLIGIAVQAVTVKTTAPTSLTITLNANAPTGGMPVAWFVVDVIGTALS